MSRAQELEALVSVANILAQPGGFQEKARKVLKELQQLSQADQVLLREPDEQGQGLRLVAVAGEGVGGLPPLSVQPYGQGISGLAFEDGRPVVANDYPSDPLALPEYVRYGTRSAAALPIKASGRTLGTVILNSRKFRHFTPERLRAVMAVADGIGTLMESAQLLESECLRSQELEAIFNIASLLVQPGGFEEKAAQAMDRLARILEADYAMLWLLDRRKERLIQVAISGALTEWAKKLPELRLEQGVSGVAATTQQPVIANEYVHHPNATPDSIEAGARAVAAVPIHAGKGAQGVVAVGSTRAGHFTSQRVSLLTAICNQLGVLLENARLLEMLERLSRQNALILNAAGEGIIGLDLKGNTSFVNPAAARMIGWEPEDLINKPLHAILHPSKCDGAPRLAEECPLSSPLGDGVVHHVTDERFWRKDCTSFPVEYISTPILDQDGQLMGAVVTFQDVSERRKAEEALRESEAKYRSFFQNSKDGVYISSRDGHWVDINPAGTELFGYSREELLSMNTADLYADPRARNHFTTEIERQGFVKDFPVLLNRKDGSTIHALITAVVREDQGGGVLGYHGIIRDITERKRLEEQLVQAQKMETVGRLAGGVAHDFNNLLTPIIGYAELGIGDLPSGSVVRGYLQEVRKAADRAASLTRQLLTFSRRQPVEPQVIDLNAILSDTDNMLRRLIGEDIELATSLAPDLGLIKVDPGQLEQVLANLVVNARDAMPSVGKLTLETANTTFDRRYARQHAEVTPGDYVMLAVSDTGTGMTDEVKAHLFEPFFTTKEKGKGTGLGLATCYGIVKQSGGHIAVYSEPEHGTTFKIYLPRIWESAEPVPQGEESGSLPCGWETVLLVEDDVMVRGLATDVLREQGYTVLEAANGDDALRVVEERNGDAIHLLLTDVVMPRMGGKELATRLRGGRADIKVLFMSGYTDNAIVHHGVLEPGTSFMQKPFSPVALAWKVREVLDN